MSEREAVEKRVVPLTLVPDGEEAGLEVLDYSKVGPVAITGHDTDERYVCAQCGALLADGVELRQLPNLAFKCQSCGSVNRYTEPGEPPHLEQAVGATVGAAAGGPYVVLATFCESALLDQDHMLSIIRLVDKVTVVISAPALAEDPVLRAQEEQATDAIRRLVASGGRPEYVHQVRFALRLYAGDQNRQAMLHLEFERPDNSVSPVPPIAIQLLRGRSANILVPMGLRIRHDGLHVLRVRLDDDVLTRVPLIVDYQVVLPAHTNDVAGVAPDEANQGPNSLAAAIISEEPEVRL